MIIVEDWIEILYFLVDVIKLYACFVNDPLFGEEVEINLCT